MATWKVAGSVNLSSRSPEYDSPQEALDTGCELGERFEHDAEFMERMALFYGRPEASCVVICHQ